MSENPFEKKLFSETNEPEAHEEEVRPLEEAAADFIADVPVQEASLEAPESAEHPKSPIPTDRVLEAQAPDSNSYVTMVEDPFGIRSQEISDAQNLDGELTLEDAPEEDSEELEDDEVLEAAPLELAPVEETNQQLENLAAALEKEEKAKAEEMKAVTEEVQAQAAKTLEAQIAEDQALEAQELAQQEAQDEAEVRAALPSVDETTGQLDLVELQSCLESILFMSDKPLSAEKLRDLIGPEFGLSIFQEALTLLRDRYQQPQFGIELVEIAGGLQFRTKPGRAALARKLAKVQTQKLSSGAMETLAIVAYRQPVMKEEIDKIRGVDSSYFVRGLMDKKMIRISGRSELPGRPMLYSTSETFLEVFGLKDLSALPSLRELEQMIPASQSKNPDDEDPRVKEMRRLVSEMKMDASGSLNYNPKDDDELLKEMREKIMAIPTSTPYLEQQKELEKQAALAAQQALESQAQPAQPELTETIPST